MCGLVGLVCKKPNGFSREHQDIFSTLLFVDTFRGKDSTGVFTINNDGDVYVAKDVGYAPRFMGTKEYQEAMSKAWNRGAAMIGHNRAATRGVVNDQNAHPFNVDNNILLVHNGTMRGNHKKHADVEVDSHAIAHMIHEKGNVAEVLSSIDAAYALIWYDVQKAELNMIRNDERPLYWMELDDAWVWSSEASMLEFAVKRVGGVKVKTEPTALPVDHLQKFILDGRKWRATAEKLEVKRPVYTHQTNQFGNYMGGNHRGYDDFDPWGVESCEIERPPFRGTTVRDIVQQRKDREWTATNNEAAAERRRQAIAVSGGTPAHPMHGYPGQTSSPGPDINAAARERATQANNSGAARFVEAREPHPFAGLEDREREMAGKLNKRVSHGHYSKIVLQRMPYNTSVHCAPFDYGYVNGKDGSDGYYLYASPFDDEDIILRQFFSNLAVTEERMMQLAGCDYVYEFTLNNRQWFPFELTANATDDTDGYCVVRCNGAKMISSGAQSNVPN